MREYSRGEKMHDRYSDTYALEYDALEHDSCSLGVYKKDLHQLNANFHLSLTPFILPHDRPFHKIRASKSVDLVFRERQFNDLEAQKL